MNSDDLTQLLKTPPVALKETGWHVIDSLHRTVFESANLEVAKKYAATNSSDSNPLTIVSFRHN